MRLDPPIWRRPADALLALAWLTLPLTAGAAMGPLLRASSATATGRAVAWVLAALGYGAGLVAILRPGALSLAALRLLSTGLVVWVGIVGAATLAPAGGGPLLALSLLIAALAWSSPVAQTHAEATAVAGERRFMLAATPGLAYLVGPLAAALAVSGVVAPVLVATGAFARPRPILAVLLLVPGLALAFFLGAAVWRLSRRWLVLVPSGVVIHDPVLLDDTYRLAPDEIGAVALTAPDWRRMLAAPGAIDLTGGAAKAIWFGLTRPLGTPGTRPFVRRPDGPVQHIFCAPLQRGLAAEALAAKGYALGPPVPPD